MHNGNDNGNGNGKWFPTKGIRILKDAGYLKMFIYLFMAAFKLMKVPDGFLSPVPLPTEKQVVVVSLVDDDYEELFVKPEDPPRVKPEDPSDKEVKVRATSSTTVTSGQGGSSTEVTTTI